MAQTIYIRNPRRAGVPSSIGAWATTPRKPAPRPKVPLRPGYPAAAVPGATAPKPYQPPGPTYESPAAPTAPVPPIAPPDTGGGGGGGGGGATLNLSNLDFSNDPILARIRAVGQESIAQAEADARAARTKLVIGYGSPALAGTLGLGGNVQGQAQGNPFSTLGELQRGYQRRNVFDVDRPLSDQANLFYSTERGRQRALSGEQYLRDQATAEAAVQEKLAGISSQLVQTKMAASTQRIQAEQEAYQRALQQALYAAGVG
jgi:hypothetical protein